MGRKCSQCGSIGHNSRTCNYYIDTTIYHHNNNANANATGVRLFGVQLDIPPPSPSASPSPSTPNPNNFNRIDYLSDDGRCAERKKGVPWTEEEHRMFLIGLDKLGKGDWKGISRNYVVTRSPTQVASHAQKYFLRQTSTNKRRSSLFDLQVCADHGHGGESSRSSKTNDYFDVDCEEKDLEMSMRSCSYSQPKVEISPELELELTLSANESYYSSS